MAQKARTISISLFMPYAKQLGAGLEEQLKWFVQEHPDTRLIIIDTLQKVRESGGDTYSYASDYEVITKLKAFADEHGICLLLVHHTRKQQAEDKFDMISGTNGLLGAADGAFLLQKERRASNTAMLDISGRDQQDQCLYLTRNEEQLIWTLERAETELWKEPPDPVLAAIAALVTAEQPQWSRTAAQSLRLSARRALRAASPANVRGRSPHRTFAAACPARLCGA
ncbi:AAA family ATPase [Agathobaculum hominis]